MSSIDLSTAPSVASQGPVEVRRRLHDVVVPQMFVITTGLASLARRSSLDSRTEVVERMLDSANNVMSELRDLSHDVDPAQRLTVGDILEEIVQGARLLSCAQSCQITVSSGENIPNSLANDLRSVLWEAISNALRHGKATEIDITIDGDPDSTVVTVSDNGNWQPRSGSGAGLKALERSAIERGGQFTVRSSSQGTVVRWSAPTPTPTPTPTPRI